MNKIANLAVLTAACLSIPHVAAADPAGFGRGEAVPASMPIGNRAGNPLIDMPPGQTLISAFGERPAFSPDGSRIAFIGSSYGDAFEYDLKSGETRNLTSHAANKGWLRIHYLADGSFLLLGPRIPAKTREETRFSRIELFWMDGSGKRAPVPLGKTVFEGVAASRTSQTIAWSEMKQAADGKGPASTTLFTARLATEATGPRLVDVKSVITTSDCFVEAQDFLPGDKGLTMPCYGFGQGGENPPTEVVSVDFQSARLTRYPTPPSLYGEVEGIFPDGSKTLVECAGDRRKGMDICVLDLDPARPLYTRMTDIVQYGGYKYGNPVVSPDARWVVAQIGPADVIDAGVGHGIVLMKLRTGF